VHTKLGALPQGSGKTRGRTAYSAVIINRYLYGMAPPLHIFDVDGMAVHMSISSIEVNLVSQV